MAVAQKAAQQKIEADVMFRRRSRGGSRCSSILRDPCLLGRDVSQIVLGLLNRRVAYSLLQVKDVPARFQKVDAMPMPQIMETETDELPPLLRRPALGTIGDPSKCRAGIVNVISTERRLPVAVSPH